MEEEFEEFTHIEEIKRALTNRDDFLLLFRKFLSIEDKYIRDNALIGLVNHRRPQLDQIFLECCTEFSDFQCRHEYPKVLE